MVITGTRINEIIKRYFNDPLLSNIENGKTINMNTRYLFRGITNEKYGIISGAAIRLKNDAKKNNCTYHQNDFISYNVNLIDKRRKSLASESFGKTDVNILAEIQHAGGATCLIDFSLNYLIALYFACGKEGQDSNVNGKVFVIDLNSSLNDKLYVLNQSYQKKNIEEILIKTDKINGIIKPRIWVWKPSNLNNRIVRQDSVFLFSLGKATNYQIDKENGNILWSEIEILKDDKDILRQLLRLYFNINDYNVFDDLNGFASIANNRTSSMDKTLLKNGTTCLSYARSLYQEEKYASALYNLDNALQCLKIKKNRCYHNCPDTIKSEIYFFKGLTYIKLADFEAAFSCLTSAEKYLSDEKADRIYDIRSQIVQVLYELQDYETALTYCLDLKDGTKTLYWNFEIIQLSIILHSEQIFINTMYVVVQEISKESINAFTLYNFFLQLGIYIFRNDVIKTDDILKIGIDMKNRLDFVCSRIISDDSCYKGDKEMKEKVFCFFDNSGENYLFQDDVDWDFSYLMEYFLTLYKETDRQNILFFIKNQELIYQEIKNIYHISKNESF